MILFPGEPSQEIYKVDFSKNNYRNEFAGFQSDEVEAQSHADSIELEISVFQTAFATATKEREKYNRGTDIIGSLKEASKYFDDDAENIIVILSDMMQYTDKTKMNMESQLNTQAEVDSYLSKIEPINLQGFKILVLTGLDYKIKPDKYNAIRMFWEVYFQRCSGNLVEYSSGMQTKLEESILEK